MTMFSLTALLLQTSPTPARWPLQVVGLLGLVGLFLALSWAARHHRGLKRLAYKDHLVPREIGPRDNIIFIGVVLAITLTSLLLTIALTG
jgi:MYXO-CTERM domain-containing protein